MDTKILVRYFVREITGLVFMGAALFWSAGRVARAFESRLPGYWSSCYDKYDGISKPS
ncbi:MAG: hypothetical protein ACYDGL_06730 [Bellilinea sp.]